MVAISQTTFLNDFPEWKRINFDYEFIEVCPKSPINNIPALNRMAWQWTETLAEICGTLADIRATTK